MSITLRDERRLRERFGAFSSKIPSVLPLEAAMTTESDLEHPLLCNTILDLIERHQPPIGPKPVCPQTQLLAGKCLVFIESSGSAGMAVVFVAITHMFSKLFSHVA